jgi:hypothetical protein
MMGSLSLYGLNSNWTIDYQGYAMLPEEHTCAEQHPPSIDQSVTHALLQDA